jgi:DNA-binding LacI/PurR family transcriptional regulator
MDYGEVTDLIQIQAFLTSISAMFANLFVQPDWRNLVDIAILTVLIYQVIKLVMHTRANSLFKGIALILILAWISDALEISALNWLLQQVISMGFLAIVIVFQPELGRRAEDTIAEEVLELRVSGAVLVGLPVEAGTTEEIRRRLCKIAQSIPIVTIGPRVEGVNCVNITSDLSVSVLKSISHLVALGHRRIAFIGGSGGLRSPSARRRAYFEEMARLGLSTNSQVSTESAHTPQGGEVSVNRLFSDTSEDERPTAIIAINDLVALGALRQLQRMGLRVPEDVALIGCDNQFFTPYLNPPLTTVDLHPFDHGACAVEELVGSLNGGSRASYSQIRECSLIVRESCGALLGVRAF